MHILLTDILTCPRCGPSFGLILLADRVENRRVLDGVLGCSNCREKYAVREGAVDFGSAVEHASASPAAPEVERLAAMLGVMHGPAFLLLGDPATSGARTLAGLLADVEVLTIGVAAEGGDVPGVNPLIASGPQLPVASGKVNAVALTGRFAETLLEEGARVMSPLGRLVLEPAPADARERLKRVGLRVAAQQDATVVAVRT